MSQEDQEALAAQWAAQLEEEANADTGTAGGGATADTAATGSGAALDDEALAAQWAEALAQDEQSKSGPEAFGGAAAGQGIAPQAEDAHFQDMTDIARQPKDNKLKRELDFILDIPLDVSAELGRTRLLINELL